MRIVEKIKRLDLFYNRMGLTIGNFEGFHRGHLEIIGSLVRESVKRGLHSAVITFKEHPLKVLQSIDPEKLAVPSDKILMFKKEGIDLLLYIDFSREFANMEPQQFLKMLHQHLSPKLICLGKGFRFGRANSGDIDLLRRYSGELGYELIAVDDVKYDGAPISSTRIRKAVKDGEFDLVYRILGRNYEVCLVPRKDDPSCLRPFISNSALPQKGVFSGDLVNLKTGERMSAELSISKNGIHTGQNLHLLPGKLYKFYFGYRQREK